MKKNKPVKYKAFNTNKIKKAEAIVIFVISIIFLIMLGFAVCNKAFIPLALISFAMLLFSICYYFIEDKDKKKLVYILFSIGVIIIIVEVIYTLVNII